MALSKIKGIGYFSIRKIYEKFPDLEEVWAEKLIDVLKNFIKSKYIKKRSEYGFLSTFYVQYIAQ